MNKNEENNENEKSNITIKNIGYDNKHNNFYDSSLNESTNSIKLFEQNFILFLDNYTNNIKKLDKYKFILQVIKVVNNRT